MADAARTGDRLRVAVTTGPVSIPPTYFVVNHLLRMSTVEGRLFALAAHVEDPQVAPLVEGMTPYGVGGLRGTAALTAAIPRLRRAVRRYAPDLVHQHFGTWSLAGSGAARDLGVPFLATLHGYEVFRYSDPVRDYWTWVTARNLRTCAARATRLLAVSEWLAGEAVRRGLPAATLEVHYQGTDTDFFVPAPRAARGTAASSRAPRVLFLSALEPRKGVLDAVEASVRLLGRVEHTLDVVGAGSLRPAVDAAAAEHPHITVSGPRDRAGVRRAMQAADVFVLPTQRDGQWREAAGLVLLEAQACGVPVVLYGSGGAPEMVEDGVGAIVVAEGDVAALADAVGAVLTLPAAERAAMGEAARRFVVARRSLSSSAAELEERYRSLVP